MCKCSREGEKSSSWRGHGGTAFLPSLLQSLKLLQMGRKGSIADCCSWHPKTLHLSQRSGESRKVPGTAVYCYLFPHFSACRGFSKADTDSDFGELQHQRRLWHISQPGVCLLLFSLNWDGTFGKTLPTGSSEAMSLSNSLEVFEQHLRNPAKSCYQQDCKNTNLHMILGSLLEETSWGHSGSSLLPQLFWTTLVIRRNYFFLTIEGLCTMEVLSLHLQSEISFNFYSGKVKRNIFI